MLEDYWNWILSDRQILLIYRISSTNRTFCQDTQHLNSLLPRLKKGKTYAIFLFIYFFLFFFLKKLSMIGSEERKSYEDDVEEESFSLLQNVKSSRRSPISKSTFLRHWRFIAIQAVLITLYTGMFWILRFHWQSSPAALVYCTYTSTISFPKLPIKVSESWYS